MSCEPSEMYSYLRSISSVKFDPSQVVSSDKIGCPVNFLTMAPEETENRGASVMGGQRLDNRSSRQILSFFLSFFLSLSLSFSLSFFLSLVRDKREKKK